MQNVGHGTCQQILEMAEGKGLNLLPTIQLYKRQVKARTVANSRGHFKFDGNCHYYF